MANYELVVIYDPYQQEGEYELQIQKVKDMVARYKGEVTSVDVWGKRRLAYPINKKEEGYYAIVLFTGEPNVVNFSEIERNLRVNELLLRNMITRVPKPKVKKPVKPKKVKSAGQSGEGYSSAGERRHYEQRSAGDAGASLPASTETAQ
ncbi:MAG: 30S ribosomal protein S6 [Candidatus Sumerlaeaceae bacterium]|nr:30S ribosomal protein S6 [Candidatus Sumerlaeaceae bacterium]